MVELVVDVRIVETWTVDVPVGVLELEMKLGLVPPTPMQTARLSPDARPEYSPSSQFVPTHGFHLGMFDGSMPSSSTSPEQVSAKGHQQLSRKRCLLQSTVWRRLTSIRIVIAIYLRIARTCRVGTLRNYVHVHWIHTSGKIRGRV